MSTTTMTVQNLCAALVKSRLLTADDVRGCYQRWQASGSATDDVEAFRKFLVRERLVTEYQVALLLRGHTDGFLLGEYKILDKIGKGRMAGVYRAQHQSGEIVAIKVLPPSKAKDPQLLARFQREGRLLTQLHHPNLVRAVMIGHDDDYNYIVMEYLEGDTLDEVLAKRRLLPIGEATRIAQQVLHGLQAIADASMVHRDIKPANIMLVPGMQAALGDSTFYSSVKILDLGLGRAVFDENAREEDFDTQLTTEGMLVGTPDYLAPEQARSARTVDIRADIYSLGCILYHMLSGQPPFPGTNVMQQIIDHATKPATPLPQLNPQVPEGLSQIVNWMMAKDPNQRCPTPASAAQALAPYVQQPPPMPTQSPEAGGSMRLRGTPTQSPEAGGSMRLRGRPAAPAQPPAPPGQAPTGLPPLAQNLAPTQAYTPIPPPGLMATEIHQPVLPPVAGAESIPVGILEGRSNKPKRGHADTAQPGPPASQPPLKEVELDVELVSADSLPALPREYPKSLEELDRRDYLMLAIGGVGVGVSMLLGYALVRLISGASASSSQEETPTE